MTAKEGYRAALMEMNKTNAPSILLEDFNYFFNKSVNMIVNKGYNSYDTNQQSSDELRVLIATSILIISPSCRIRVAEGIP